MNFSSPQFWERFNLDSEENECEVSTRPGSYRGLDPKALYTSTEDLINIVGHPLVDGTFVDLGSGTGKSCLIYSAIRSKKSIGVEFEESRIEVGERVRNELGIKETEFVCRDLLTSPVPKGDTYFLYFPTGMVLDKILTELYESKRFFRIVAIESHGDLLPRLEKENWLKVVAEIPLKSIRHNSQARIYERMERERSPELLPHTLSFKEKFLLIRDGETWIGESLGLEWHKNSSFELQTPPRTIEWKDVQAVLNLGELEVKIQKAILLRRQGELQVRTKDRTVSGYIRKIIIKPSFRLEISSGEKVEWNEIVAIHQGSKLCYGF